MNVRVAYYSATGNTRKVAGAIADALGCEAVGIDAYPADGVELLFLGAAVYATHGHGVHQAVKDFVAGLDPAMVGKVALFSTGFIQSEAIPILRGLLAARGIPVAEESFFCLGRFALFNLGRPNAVDLLAAAEFAKRTLHNR
ncbi:MAG: flavodoxin [Spirochaetes bacterium]|nr:flavodoxin [Spirochaetota bacterium]MBU1081419.1 flavodoxin [Spirochaetota bacterium]